MPESPAEGLPTYENPPVVEVVCGVFFQPIKLQLPHYGLLWQKFKGDYPRFEEAIPLIRAAANAGEITLTAADIPLPRLWFISADDTSVVQIQRNCFLTNWRRVRPTDEYPRYQKVIELHNDRLTSFKTFLEEQELGSLVPNYYEMTYVNHLPQGDGWETLDEIGELFPDLAWRREPSRYLTSISGVNQRLTFEMPEQMGQLLVAIQSAERRPDMHKILTFELTARGKPQDHSEDQVRRWFDLARKTIVRGFTDLTSGKAQRDLWKRTR